MRGGVSPLPGSSPLVLKSLRPVTLRLVVLGRRLGAQGAALFPIEALPADGVLRVSASFGEANGSVLVEVSANREAAAVRFLCSLHGRDFEECECGCLWWQVHRQKKLRYKFYCGLVIITVNNRKLLFNVENDDGELSFMCI